MPKSRQRMQRSARGGGRHPDARAIPAADANHLAIERFVTPQQFDQYRDWALASRIPRVRVGSVGALELPRRAGAGAQQRRLLDNAAPPRRSGMNAMTDAPLIRRLGLAPYEPTWRAMQRFTDERGAATRDEIWFVEHPPVFTLGMNASREHLLVAGRHPGRADRSRRPGHLSRSRPARDLSADRFAAASARRARTGRGAGERGHRLRRAARRARRRARATAPGVYVDGAKLASIGLRIRRGASYHGLAFNVSLDLAAVSSASTCAAIRGLAVTRLVDLCGTRRRRMPSARGLTPHLLRESGIRSALQRHQHRLAGGQFAVNGVQLLAAAALDHGRSSPGNCRRRWCARALSSSAQRPGVALDDGARQSARRRCRGGP